LINPLKKLTRLLEKIADILCFLRRKPGLTLTLLSLFNLLLRVTRHYQDNFSTRDSKSYLAVIKEINEVGWSAVYTDEIFGSMPPGLFGILRFGDRIGIGAESIGMIFIALCGIGLILLVYWGTYNITESKTYALIAALFAATNPLTVRYGAHILRDLPYWCCGAGFIACGIKGIKQQQLRYFFIAALFMSGAILFRKEGIELYMGFLLWCIFSLLMDRTDFWLRLRFSILSLLLVSAVAAVILLPLEEFLSIAYGSKWQVAPWIQIYYFWLSFIAFLRYL
jgi:4-amino-4-deoxy-L-arabinose transferase-like glycosyltransferase